MASERAIDIGRRIRESRTSAGLTQDEVARQAGVSPSYLSRLEAGSRVHPRLIHLRCIARVLGIPFEELVADAGPPDELLDALVALTGEPALSRSLLDLARNWGLLSPSDRRWTLHAIDRALESLSNAGAESKSAESKSEEIQSTGRSRAGLWRGWPPNQQ
jgi:transcriptional regulator with XRE-family HTH domain